MECKKEQVMEEKVKLQIRNMKKHYKNGDGVENINMDVR